MPWRCPAGKRRHRVRAASSGMGARRPGPRVQQRPPCPCPANGTTTGHTCTTTVSTRRPGIRVRYGSANDTACTQLATPWSASLRAVWTATMSLVRLYLSSFRTGQHPERLLGVAGVGRRTALVPNALDGLDAQVRAAGLDR